jgi:hypothetical protein
MNKEHQTIYESEIYPKWITKACDRIASKPDTDPLTNVETDALIRYLHGDKEMEAE